MFSERLALWIDRFLVPIDDPGSRLFHMNILVSLAMILAWWGVRNQSFSPRKLARGLKSLVFRSRYWWNRSTRLDYKIYALNSVLKIALFLPLLDFGFYFATQTARFLVGLNTGDFLGLPASPVYLFIFSVFAFAFDDLLRFLHHRLMHAVPLLWRLHRVHHSARILTPITLYRTHPLESAMATIRNSLSLGVLTGIFLFCFEARLSVATFFGINVFGFLFNLLGANLRHSHIPLSFGPMERIFISPKQHQIHHSRDPRHFDSNFGVSLALWDWLGRSLVRSEAVSAKLRFGVEGSQAQASLAKALLRP